MTTKFQLNLTTFGKTYDFTNLEDAMTALKMAQYWTDSKITITEVTEVHTVTEKVVYPEPKKTLQDFGFDDGLVNVISNHRYILLFEGNFSQWCYTTESLASFRKLATKSPESYTLLEYNNLTKEIRQYSATDGMFKSI